MGITLTGKFNFAGTSLYTPGSFTPPVIDPYFNNNMILLNGETTSSYPGNRTFTDLSSRNHTISVGGNSTQGSFTPFSRPQGMWSTYFSGAGDYLTTDSSPALAFGTGAFTIEAWINSSTSGNFGILQNSPTAGNGNHQDKYFFSVSSAGVLGFYRHNNVAAIETAAGAVPNGTWTHVAVCRDGTSVRLYVNGQKLAESTSSTLMSYNVGQFQNTIGYLITPMYATGYLSNLRVVKGTALYTANFTPSTSPLTSVPGTALLTCTGNTFKDYSSNNLGITPTSFPKISVVSPFASQEYNPAVSGGSAFFTPGSWIGVENHSDFLFGAGDYTVETWINAKNLDQFAQIAGIWSYTQGAGQAWAIFLHPNGQVMHYVDPNDSQVNVSTTTIKPNAWYHVAVTRASGTFRLFINGKLESTTSAPGWTMNNGSFALNIGGLWDSPANWFNGYISDLRIYKGQALYTTDFAIPTAPQTDVSNPNLKFAVNASNAGVVDATGINDVQLFGGAVRTTTEKKYGTGSIELGAGKYLVAQRSEVAAIGTGDFTFEGWYNIANTDTYQFLATSNVGGELMIALSYPANSISIGRHNVAWDSSFSSITVPAANVWNHIAITRQNGVLRCFVNGTQVGTNINNTVSYSMSNFCMGNVPGYSGSTSITGYVDNVRMTVGVARYTSNFTPADF